MFVFFPPLIRFLLVFQNLPKPPVPSLEDTIVRYLAGLEPVIPSQQFEQTRQTAQIFLHNGEGKGLQKLLTEYAEESDNWVSQLTKQQNARCPILIPSAAACHCATKAAVVALRFECLLVISALALPTRQCEHCPSTFASSN